MNKIVTCKTENCENSNIPIAIVNPENLVICGVCSFVITDKLDGEPAKEPTEI